jgi:hypothetical protein
MDTTEQTNYEDWLEKELIDMNVDGGTRDLVFREENITRMLNEKNVRNVNNMKPDLISKEAYENGGSWVMDRWVCPTVRRGRGKNEDNVCLGRKDNNPIDNDNVRPCINRKRRRQQSSSTRSRKIPPSSSSCSRSGPRRIVSGRRRLGRGWNIMSGTDTAIQAISGWKSSQDCKEGCVPDNESAPELIASQDEGHHQGEGAHDQLQGAGEGGVVAPGVEGGVGGGQGVGAGHGHHPDEVRGEQRAGQGTESEGVCHDGEEQRVQGGHVQDTTGVRGRKPRPMYFRKKRGIVPDGLVQMRLSNFKTQFPNLQSNWAVTNGQISTNGREAASQREFSTNGETNRKRKLDQDFAVARAVVHGTSNDP